MGIRGDVAAIKNVRQRLDQQRAQVWRPHERQRDAAKGDKEWRKRTQQLQRKNNQGDQRQGNEPFDGHALGKLGISDGVDDKPERQAGKDDDDEDAADDVVGWVHLAYLTGSTVKTHDIPTDQDAEVCFCRMI